MSWPAWWTGRWAELEPTLQELEDAAIIYPFQYIDDGYYDFRHQLLRDAIYDAVPPSQLRRFHAQAAEFVMTLEASSVVHASRHYEKAGLRSQAFRTSLTAADEASRISARQEAYELYQRAIANMPDDLPVLERAKLFDAYSNAAGAIEHNEDAEMAAIRARQLYLEAGRPIDAATQQIAMFSVALRRGEPTENVLAYVQQGFAEISNLPPTPERESLRSWLMILEAECLFLSLDLSAARERAVEARALATSLGDREAVLDTEILLGRIEVIDGNYESGMRDGMRAAREARDAGYESTGVTGYRNMALLAARIMDPQAAEAAIAEGLQYADAIEQSHCRQMIAGTLALLEWAAGHWDAADARARQDLSDRGCRRGMIGGQDVLGLVAMGRGRPDEARRWLAESLAIGRRIGEVHLILTPLWGLAETDLLEGKADAAAERCEEAWSIASSTGERALFIPFVVTGARAYVAARRPDEAEKWLAQAREFFVGWDSVAGAALSHAEGLVRLAGGSLTAAREAFERGDPRLGGSGACLGSGRRPTRPRAVPDPHEPARGSRRCAGAGQRSRPGDGQPAAGGAGRRDRQAEPRSRPHQGAVAAADRARIRGGATDRGGYDECADCHRAVRRTQDGECSRRAHPGQAGGRPAHGGCRLGRRPSDGRAAAARHHRRTALRRCCRSRPPRSKVVAPSMRQTAWPR